MEISLGGQGHAASAHASHVDEDGKLRLGMLFYVIVDVMFALFLVSAYVFLRAANVNNLWFPSGTHNIDQTVPTILTAILVLSGLLYIAAHWGVTHNAAGIARVAIPLAALAWIVSTIGNFYYMGHLPFTTAGGGFASMYILFTGYHIYHLLFGLLIVIGASVRAIQGRYTAEKHVGVTVIGYFWYWAVLFGIIGYLLPIALPGPLH